MASIVLVAHVFSGSLKTAHSYARCPSDGSSFAGYAHSLRPEDGMPDSVVADRHRRTVLALCVGGRHTIRSSFVTFFTSFWLLCCMLTFHVRFGCILLSATIFSLLNSLIFLP